jgi:hypothetical protein
MVAQSVKFQNRMLNSYDTVERGTDIVCYFSLGLWGITQTMEIDVIQVTLKLYRHTTVFLFLLSFTIITSLLNTSPIYTVYFKGLANALNTVVATPLINNLRPTFSS